MIIFGAREEVKYPRDQSPCWIKSHCPRSSDFDYFSPALNLHDCSYPKFSMYIMHILYYSEERQIYLALETGE